MRDDTQPDVQIQAWCSSAICLLTLICIESISSDAEDAIPSHEHDYGLRIGPKTTDDGISAVPKQAFDISKREGTILQQACENLQQQNTLQQQQR